MPTNSIKKKTKNQEKCEKVLRKNPEMEKHKLREHVWMAQSLPMFAKKNHDCFI